MLSDSFCVRLYYACSLCCLGIALSAIIFILFRYSVCFNTHWDHGPWLMREKQNRNNKTKPLHSSMCWQMQSIKQCFTCACISACSVPLSAVGISAQGVCTECPSLGIGGAPKPWRRGTWGRGYVEGWGWMGDLRALFYPNASIL